MSKYVDCHFILGSAAIAEILWREQDHLLDNKQRRSMTLRTVDAIFFLKKNDDLWDIKDVNQTNEDRKKEKRDERYKKKFEQEAAELLAMMRSLNV